MEKKLPLFIVTGASGSGKTFVINELRKLMPEFDVFDLDYIGEFIDNDWAKMRDIWLRVARNIAYSGRMTILCGTMMPWDTEKCVDYNHFEHVYYLNLHCEDETRKMRLRYRNWPEEMIQEHIHFAKWLIENADKAYTPPMPIVDTTNNDVSHVAIEIKGWIEQYI